MIAIMKELHKYVPQIEEEVPVILEEETINAKEINVYKILLGGDQLISARARGAQAAMSHGDDAVDRLEGLVPVTEDWHTKQALLTVSTVNLGTNAFYILQTKYIYIYIYTAGYLFETVSRRHRLCEGHTKTLSKHTWQISSRQGTIKEHTCH